MCKKIRRNTFTKNLKAGMYTARCKEHLTDDYAFDAATNFGRTEMMEARYFPSFWTWLDEVGLNDQFKPFENDIEASKIRRRYQEERDAEGGMVFTDETIKMADIYQDDETTVALYVHSNLSYELKVK